MIHAHWSSAGNTRKTVDRLCAQSVDRLSKPKLPPVPHPCPNLMHSCVLVMGKRVLQWKKSRCLGRMVDKMKKCCPGSCRQSANLPALSSQGLVKLGIPSLSTEGLARAAWRSRLQRVAPLLALVVLVQNPQRTVPFLMSLAVQNESRGSTERKALSHLEGRVWRTFVLSNAD